MYRPDLYNYSRRQQLKKSPTTSLLPVMVWRVFTVKINGIEIEYQQLKSTNTLPERMH